MLKKSESKPFDISVDLDRDHTSQGHLEIPLFECFWHQAEIKTGLFPTSALITKTLRFQCLYISSSISQCYRK